MEKTEHLLKIYLQGMKKPLKIIVNDNSIAELRESLMTCDIIKFGPFIFQRDSFIFCEIE